MFDRKQKKPWRKVHAIRIRVNTIFQLTEAVRFIHIFESLCFTPFQYLTRFKNHASPICIKFNIFNIEKSSATFLVPAIFRIIIMIITHPKWFFPCNIFPSHTLIMWNRDIFSQCSSVGWHCIACRAVRIVLRNSINLCLLNAFHLKYLCNYQKQNNPKR